MKERIVIEHTFKLDCEAEDRPLVSASAGPGETAVVTFSSTRGMVSVETESIDELQRVILALTKLRDWLRSERGERELTELEGRTR